MLVLRNANPGSNLLRSRFDPAGQYKSLLTFSSNYFVASAAGRHRLRRHHAWLAAWRPSLGSEAAEPFAESSHVTKFCSVNSALASLRAAVAIYHLLILEHVSY